MMVISCISVSTYKRLTAFIVGLAISAVTLSAQQRADTVGVAAEIVHYGEAIMWVKPAALLNEQHFIPFSVDLVRGDSARVYVSQKSINALFSLGFESFRLYPKPAMLKASSLYRTYDQYVTYCGNLQKQYPELVECDTIGYSASNKAIIVLKFNPSTVSKSEVLLVGSIHGDEPQGYTLLQALADSLTSGYATSAFIKNLVDNTHLYLIPAINPDGLFRVSNSVTTSSTRYNANYVDLNRNYPDFVVGSSADGNVRQPETQALIDFAAKHRICLSVGFHSGAEVVNYPWDSKAGLHPDDTWLMSVAQAYANSVQKYGSANYFTDVTSNGITNGYAWYLVNGGQQDFMTAFAGSREFTIEVSESKWLASTNIATSWAYNKQAMLNLAAVALTASRGELVDANTGLPVVGKVWTANTDTAFCGVTTDSNGVFYKFIDDNKGFIARSDGYADTLISSFTKSSDLISIALRPTIYTNITDSYNTTIQLYPTVFDNELNLSNLTNIPLTISVFDIRGQKRYEVDIKQSGRIVLPNIPKGIYLVKAKSLSKTWVFKVIKQ